MNKRPEKIGITRIQLEMLLNEKEKKGFDFMLKKGVYCATCDQSGVAGVRIDKLTLNSLNDVLIEGTCSQFNGKVFRTVEFGENPDFYRKVIEFRQTLDN